MKISVRRLSPTSPSVVGHVSSELGGLEDLLTGGVDHTGSMVREPWAPSFTILSWAGDSLWG